jgi:hypothetical protein
MPVATRASAWALIRSSSMSQPKAFHELQPMGGVMTSGSRSSSLPSPHATVIAATTHHHRAPTTAMIR